MRITRSTAVTICLFTSVTWGQTTEPGWGLLVNRTQDPVTIDVADSRGRRTAWTIQPDTPLRLRADTTYRVAVRRSGFSAVLDARPMYMDVSGDHNLRAPVWEHISPEMQSRSPWSTRWYQVTEVDGQAQLRSGFSTRDIDQILKSYRDAMDALGFEMDGPVVYELDTEDHGFDHDDSTDAPPDEAAMRDALGRAARHVQHRTLTDSVLQLLASNAPDMEFPRGEVEFAWGGPGVRFYVGKNEVEYCSRMHFPDFAEPPARHGEHNVDVTQLDCVVVLPETQISPEVYRLMRRVAAGAFNVSYDRIAVIADAGSPTAGSGFSRLRAELSGNPDQIPRNVIREISRAINSDPFLRTLRFSAFTQQAVATRTSDAQVQGTLLESRNDWRYHGISDDVAFMETIESMRGMHLRWQVVIACTLIGLRSGEPQLEATVYLAIETKRGVQSATKYAPWSTTLSQFWIRPKGGTFGNVDVESIAFQLQNRILEQCTDL